MIKWIIDLFKKDKKKDINQEDTEKVFEFSVLEMNLIGDKYNYNVKAKTKEKAFEKLVRYFCENISSEDIKSRSYVVESPNNYVFNYTNMPGWFARYISGIKKEGDHESLNKYLTEHNIKLKE